MECPATALRQAEAGTAAANAANAVILSIGKNDAMSNKRVILYYGFVDMEENQSSATGFTVLTRGRKSNYSFWSNSRGKSLKRATTKTVGAIRWL